ncbi:MAG TPA: glycosyltransferase family 39 protein [Terriglobia bacterium]|nr:glycosyltransferase family 39 protein [Terriglobia bacterium]
MRYYFQKAAILIGVWGALLTLHAPFLRLPYYWDEAGYYIPAALDFFRRGLLIPTSTLPSGHTPLVMIYLALAWQVFGFSPLVTRAAMLMLAAATLLATASLADVVFGERPTARAAVCVSAALLALAPIYFAQSSSVFLDLPVALFTALALVALLRERWAMFGAMASCAVLSKETAIILAPVAYLFLVVDAKRTQRSIPPSAWFWLTSPCLVLAAWASYYHHRTGFWTGNATYLQYNLYSTLDPVRILLCFARRLHEVFIAGFNWIVAAAALAAAWWTRKAMRLQKPTLIERRFRLLTALLTAAYLLLLSAVGGAVLPRYTLPLYPPLIVLALSYIWRLPQRAAYACCLAAAVCFVGSWFLNPPYPFPFEDNLAYADFIRLHQQGAQFLASLPEQDSLEHNSSPRILTAWPATNELETPDLGYVTQPLNVVPVEGFSAQDFESVQPGSFDVLYSYSRKWEPPNNWLVRFPWLERLESRYFDYSPQMPEDKLQARFHLRRLARWERRGQWVAIYQAEPSP